MNNRFLIKSRFLSVILAQYKIQGFDVKSLRAFRVIRPLKLVNGVPSKYRYQPRFISPYDLSLAFHYFVFVPACFYGVDFLR